DDDVATLGTRHRTLHEKELALDVHANDLETLRGALHVAVLARHALARKDTTRILRHADRTSRVVRDRVTVRGAVRREVVTLDRAGESLADRHTRDVDLLANLEEICIDCITGVHRTRLIGIDAKLRDTAAGLDARLG